MGEHVVCRDNYQQAREIHGAVYSCNMYMNASLPRFSMMQEIAWDMKTDKSGKVVGFTAPDKDKVHEHPGR
jgi:hypothetical protein